MNVCLKDCFLFDNFFCSSKKICSEGSACRCVNVWCDFDDANSDNNPKGIEQ